MNFNAEMIEKAKVAKTAEELYEIAKANGVEMTEDEAKTYFAQLNPKSGELDDDELECLLRCVRRLNVFFGERD